MGFKIENIGKPKGIKRTSKRVGRGIGSGRGKTSGRGHKGAKQRSGGGVYNPGFEGGQMPLIRRLPKRGFTNKWRKEWSIINLCTLEDAAAVKNGAVVDKDFLLANRMIRKRQYPFKVLGKGKFTKSVTVKANSFSESAKKAIEAVGGKAEVVKYIPANKKAGE